MIKLFSTIIFLSSFSLAFSQEVKKELSVEDKQALRENHKPGLTFKTSPKPATKNDLNFTDSTEEKEEDVDIKTTTTVKYYHGTKDSLYKEFKYTKED